jgi:hypothetical protein
MYNCPEDTELLQIDSDVDEESPDQAGEKASKKFGQGADFGTVHA